MLILGIDTSCDETSAAVSRNQMILSNVIYSQIEEHRPWGGVKPDVAKNAHLTHIDEVVTKALRRAKIKPDDLDAVAVTLGPGLAIALEVGIAYAKKLAKNYNLKIIPVNHLEGHLLSFLAKNAKGRCLVDVIQLVFPAAGLLVSGGHTEIIEIKKIGQYQIIGETLDDAAGEAFDKIAKMLGLGYPGGPVISFFAGRGQPIYQLPIPMLKRNDYNFSFSGLKTAVKNFLSNYQQEKNQQFMVDFCASVEHTIVQSIAIKLDLYLKNHSLNFLTAGGGVVNNLLLRKTLRFLARKYKIPIYLPQDKKLLSDNAAMIALAASLHQEDNCFLKSADRVPAWRLDEKIL